jgi:hypothetical protein
MVDTVYLRGVAFAKVVGKSVRRGQFVFAICSNVGIWGFRENSTPTAPKVALWDVGARDRSVGWNRKGDGRAIGGRQT